MLQRKDGKQMKIAVLSDIHGNYPALKLVLEDAVKQNANEIYSLGDQTGFFPYLGKALDLLDEYNVTCIQGNYEESDGKHLRDENEWVRQQEGGRDFGALPRVLDY